MCRNESLQLDYPWIRGIGAKRSGLERAIRRAPSCTAVSCADGESYRNESVRTTHRM